MTPAERGLWTSGGTHRDLAVFTERALRLDEAAVVRLRERADGLVIAWAATGFDVLASRAVAGRVRPVDLTVAADTLARGLAAPGPDGHVDPGYPMDSAWRGALPPDGGFAHVDDVPARAVLDLARRGGALAREAGGAARPPASLLDQQVIEVSAGDVTVGVPMRCVFALVAMGFVPPDAGDDEVVRVRATRTWLRIDARFGSVYRHRGGPALLVG